MNHFSSRREAEDMLLASGYRQVTHYGRGEVNAFRSADGQKEAEVHYVYQPRLASYFEIKVRGNQ